MSVSRVEIYNVMELMQALLDGKWIVLNGHYTVYRLSAAGMLQITGTGCLDDAIKDAKIDVHIDTHWDSTSHDIKSFCMNANQGRVRGWSIVYEPESHTPSHSIPHIRKVEL